MVAAPAMRAMAARYAGERKGGMDELASLPLGSRAAWLYDDVLGQAAKSLAARWFENVKSPQVEKPKPRSSSQASTAPRPADSLQGGDPSSAKLASASASATLVRP